MTERKLYVPANPDQKFVAGARVPADGILRLTDKQAAYEKTLGNIKPYVPVKDEPAPPAVELDGDKKRR